MCAHKLESRRNERPRQTRPDCIIGCCASSGHSDLRTREQGRIAAHSSAEQRALIYHWQYLGATAHGSRAAAQEQSERRAARALERWASLGRMARRAGFLAAVASLRAEFARVERAGRPGERTSGHS